MTFLKIAKGAVGLCASIVLLTGCLKEDYPSTELFTWKAKVDVTDKAVLSVNYDNGAGPTGQGENSEEEREGLDIHAR